MKKAIIVLWVLFVIYTIYHLLTDYQSVLSIQDLMFSDVNPLIFMTFNLLGVIPLGFLLLTFKYQSKLNVYQKIGLILGFVSGAFAILPTISSLKLGHPKQGVFIKIGALSGIIISIALLFYGISSGSVRNYISLFLSDSLVHIMTIDMMVLYIASVITMKPLNRKWYISWIPFFGFFYLLYE
jgi:hypothetical protein